MFASCQETIKTKNLSSYVRPQNDHILNAKCPLMLKPSLVGLEM
uniref:Uncharacterized protein n=1 Tax=Rhizophora mucronata TaxID=61149 RepID=A0A2P2P101_RHIMU